MKNKIKYTFFINISIILTIHLLIIPSISIAQKLVVGYYPDWLKSSLPISKIQFNNLTHIVHSFAWPTATGEIEHYSNMLNPDLNAACHQSNTKILIALGGAGLSDGFGPMVSDTTTRRDFVNNVFEFIDSNNYDGIDIDWEFPQNEIEKKGLTKLVKELREKFNSENSNLLITMAVNSSHWGGQHFEFEEMLQYIDWYSMMGYDVSGGWLSFAGHNSPLYRGNNDWSWNDGYNYLHNSRSIPNEKLLLGMPFYGKQFYSSNLYNSFTGSVTNLRYNQIISSMSSGTWEYKWDDISKVSYLLNNSRTKFVTYDDTNSVKEKVKYALDKDVKGVMIWAIGQDIIGSSQPLLETIANTLNNITEVDFVEENLPNSFRLNNNYPNPFNPNTTISFSIPSSGKVILRIFDMIGMEVTALRKDREFRAGENKISLNMEGFASGTYLLNVAYRNNVLTKKIILLK